MGLISMKTVNKKWIGFDLDGTLAYFDGWRGPHHIGPPLAGGAFSGLTALELAKRYLGEGREVKIFTARLAGMNTICPVTKVFQYKHTIVRPIREWCLEHLGQKLQVTNIKDWDMEILYDDRAFHVHYNTGIVSQYSHTIP